jgi:DNA-binding CsgD family transcriptional regulator
MSDWISATLESLRESASMEQSFQAIADAARQLGFEWCAYGYQYPLPFTRTECFLINNYADRWKVRYDEARYLQVDPTVIRARSSIEPIVWQDQSVRGAAQFWDEASSFGLQYGWAQSCFGPDGAIGLLSLARSHDPLGQAEQLQKEPHLRCLVNVAHTALSSHLTRTLRPEPRKLTPREREVMRWMADGKTSAQIAQIMGLSRFTVEFHLKNAVGKLGAGTRSAAVARAAVIGLLR